jgi:hypothetical protein
MRYVICHGEFPKPSTTFVSSANIGLFVRNVGDPLPQIEAVQILLYGKQPTHWMDTKKADDLWLTPIAHHEWFALNQALGNDVVRDANPHFLDGPTTLSALVTQLNDTELRMITCTVGGPTQTHQSDLVQEDKFGKRVKLLLRERLISAAAAAKYLEGLKEGARTFWLGNPDVYEIMTEWAVTALPPITDNLASWVDTLAYLTARDGLAAQMYGGGQYGFPNYGQDLRARIDAINGYLVDWPDCVWRMDFATQNHNGFHLIRGYLDNPVGRDAARVTQFWRMVNDEFKPLVAKATAMQAGGPPAWRDYLQALAAVDNQRRAGLVKILDLTGWEQFLVTTANNWPDFPTSWRDIVTNYGTTIAPLLRASTDATLQSRIAAAEAPPPVQQQAPVAVVQPVVAQPVRYQVYCESCDGGTPHEAVVAMDIDGEVEDCQGCSQTVGSSDARTSLECQTCQSRLWVHNNCLASFPQV